MLMSCSVAQIRTTVPDIPKTIDGWKADEEIRTYNRKTLFDYINGGAELYLAYRFRKAYVYRYTKPEGPDIVLDVYDMGTPKDAFGVFTAEREGDEIGIGQGSEYDTGLLRFFKGSVFVSILVQEETPESRKAVFSLARAVANGIESDGDKPQVILSLPRQGLMENSVRYFYSPTILNIHFYVADENILALDEGTEAVLARYDTEDGQPYLLVVRYPSTERAKSAFAGFLNAYMPDAAHGVVQTENGKWTAAGLYSASVAVVLDASSQGHAQTLLDAVRRHVEVGG